MNDLPKFGTKPIRCGSWLCNWKGYETDMAKEAEKNGEAQSACPSCGCRSYMFMTAKEISAWRRSKTKTAYRRYRVSEWIDTSEEGLNQPEVRLAYGVQVQVAPRGPWMHCLRGTQPMLFKTPAEAAAACEELQKEPPGIADQQKTAQAQSPASERIDTNGHS